MQQPAQTHSFGPGSIATARPPPGLEEIARLSPEAVAVEMRSRQLASKWSASSAEVTALLLRVMSVTGAPAKCGPAPCAPAASFASGCALVRLAAEALAVPPMTLSTGHLAQGAREANAKAIVSEHEDLASTNDSGTRDFTEVLSDTESEGQATTLMVRNIPTAYTEEMLTEEWPMDLGYDFFYLPRNNKGKASLGYAFLNFASEAQAETFRARFHKTRLTHFDAPKPLNISLAEVQGFEANVDGLKHKAAGRIKHCQPIIVKGGRRLSLDEV